MQKIAEDGPTVWVPAIHVRDLDEVLATDSKLVIVAILGMNQG